MNQPHPEEVIAAVNTYPKNAWVSSVDENSYHDKISPNAILVHHPKLAITLGDVEIFVEDDFLRTQFSIYRHRTSGRYKKKFRYSDYGHINDMVPDLMNYIDQTIEKCTRTLYTAPPCNNITVTQNITVGVFATTP